MVSVAYAEGYNKPLKLSVVMLSVVAPYYSTGLVQNILECLSLESLVLYLRGMGKSLTLQPVRRKFI